MEEGRVKLALVMPGGVDRGGEFRVIPVLLGLIERLARAHEVHVFALHQEAQPDRWRLAGADIHNIGEDRTVVRAIAAIRREHRCAPFDAIHAIFSGHGGLVAVIAACLLHRPALVHVAGGEIVALPEIGYGGRLTWKGRLRERWVLRNADVVTAASAPMVDALRELGVDAQRVPLGIDLHGWPPRAPRERRDTPARLIHVASLNRVKDQGTLLHALAMLAKMEIDFVMDIVGADTLQGEMMRLADALGLRRRVRFHGFKTQRQLRPMLESADLLVMSSLHEAGPVVLLEAAAAGVPAVGTAVGHVSEWAPSAALAVPPRNAEALANAIRTVLDDEPLRLRLARAAQCRALLEDADCTSRAFERLYRSAKAKRTHAVAKYAG